MARSLHEFLGHPRWRKRRMLDAIAPPAEKALSTRR
jgi:hypothetical protein